MNINVLNGELILNKATTSISFWKFLTIGLLLIIIFSASCIILFKTYVPTKTELKEFVSANSVTKKTLQDYIEKDSTYALERPDIYKRLSTIETSIIGIKKTIDGVQSDANENRIMQEKQSAKIDTILAEIKRKP